uniref:Beta-glucuronidase C-terminal domain-containing protein n=1 Tax=Psilocybe cubensis TaxID=181762 RepID=A0A8H7XVC6_PSICU
MSNIQSRAGRIYIRVGGNTQETAVLVDRTSDGRILEKDLSNVTNPVRLNHPQLLYMLHNISSLVNVRWYLGVPFNDSANFRLGIAEQGQAILGDFLVGLQAGNEPDLYGDHGHRPPTYGPYDYFGEFGVLVNAMNNDGNIPNRGLLIGPSVSTGKWTPEQIWDTGFVDAYSSSLAYLSVEHYPTDNCYAQYGTGTPRDAQSLFPTYLTHTSAQTILAPYLNSTTYAQSKSKRMLMFETNTASCGGFAGISDAFGAALWGVDYALQMAHSNFSGALFHVGGQNVYYNPFTPPPTNQSTFRKWTIGPIYYAALVTAEALGPSNTTQILDLQANNNNVYTPAYAIYEGGTLKRVVVVNFASDLSGGSDLEVSLSLVLGGGGGGGTVQVKYLRADSVAQKGNFTWGGQTFGATFASDGRLEGVESIQSVSCSTSDSQSQSQSGVCTIKVPAPSIALIFLTPDAQTEGKGGVPRAPAGTFATSLVTRTRNTATVDPGVLATSNGHTGMDRVVGSTSEGRVSGALGRAGVGVGGVGGVVALGMGVLGGVVLVFGF